MAKLINKDAVVKKSIELSKGAAEAIYKLQSTGFEAWAVGGCVRDVIMGNAPKDFDITTNALPKEVKKLFEEAGIKTFDTGIKHGTVSVLFECGAKDGEIVEVTTYRTDGKYRDSRHPDKVTFVTSIDEDLLRRDFTMNAIAYNPEIGLYDPHLGLNDIESGVIRCVGSPKKRFSEDALRILRACRFVSTTGFEIEDDTFEAARASKSKLIAISNERITSELNKLLAGECVLKALLECADLIEVVVPEITACRGFDQQTKYHAYDVYEHIAHVVDHVKNTQTLRLAALCHDIGKPSMFFKDETGQGHFYGHAIQSKRLAENLLRRIRIKEKDKTDILTLVERHNDTLKPTEKCITSTIKLMNGNVSLFRDLLDLKRADSLGHAPDYTDQVHIYDQIEDLLDDMIDKGIVFDIHNLEINGRDLITLGLKEGPIVQDKLNVALMWVQGKICKNNKEELLTQMKKHLLR